MCTSRSDAGTVDKRILFFVLVNLFSFIIDIQS